MSDIIIPNGVSEKQLKQAINHGGRVDIPVKVPQKIVEAQKEIIHEGQLILEALKEKASCYENVENEDLGIKSEEYAKLRALMWLVKLNLPPEV